MQVKVKFLGGAKTVTGSKYLIEINDEFRFLFDCGMFQGLKELRLRNWDKLPIEASTINAVVISHAHIDHTGYLPRLCKEGFTGAVYCTPSTGDLMEIMLMDSARLQEEEAEFAKRKGYSKHAEPKPLYDTEDSKKVFPLLKRYNYKKRFKIHPKIEVTYHDAGHLLGSAITEVFIQGDRETKKLVFSGDLGRYDQEVMNDPTTITEADVLFVESTYGTRENDVKDLDGTLAKIIHETFDNNGVLLVPAFAVGRTQTFLHYLRKLMDRDLIPDVPVYIDSPMAISASSLYARYPECHKMNFNIDELTKSIETKTIVFCKSKEQSKHLNTLKKNAIIISASGMMTGGRILHHLYNRLPNQQDTLLIIGYQAAGTRGRKILDGDKNVRIFGVDVPIRCRKEYISGLSGHADRSELFRWLGNFKDKPKYTFTIHGENDIITEYASHIRTQFAWNVIVPEYLENMVLFDGV